MGMGFIAWIVVGLVAGALAKLIIPGKQGGGFFATLILGVIGALVGGFIGNALFGAGTNSGFNFVTVVWATIGALLVSFIWAAIVKRRA